MGEKKRELLEHLRQKLQDTVTQAKAYETVLKGNGQALVAINAIRQNVEETLCELEDLLDDEVTEKECPLTKRELQILRLVAQGLLNKQIAYELGISDRTVQFHLKSIFNKFAVSSRTEAVVHSIENKWLDL